MRNLNLDPKYLLKRWGPPILLLLAFLAFVIWINQVDKTQLVSREGQTFEKAVVTEIIQDNLMPDGSRPRRGRSWRPPAAPGICSAPDAPWACTW